MKIGIISDSHDDVDNVNRAIGIFEKEKVKAVIHAGDIISPPIIKEFKRLTDDGVEFFGIFGNNDGERKGWTTSISPGHLQMQCGRDSTKEEDSCVIYADNGNIIINAGNGNLRFIANNVEFTVKGDNGSEGNFKVNASESILLEAKKIQCDAKNFLKLATPGKMEICANENLKLYGGIIRGVTDAVSGKDSKLGGKNFWEKQQP